MSEHIKTGQEIFREILEYSDGFDQHEWSNLKFVSLSWLKENLTGKLHELQSKDDIWISLEQVLSLLEDK